MKSSQRLCLYLLLPLLLLLAAPNLLLAAELAGVVLDNQTLAPIANAELVVAGHSTRSDSKGRFRFADLPTRR